MDQNEAAVALFDRHAGEYARKYMDVGHYAPSLELLCAGLPAGAHVLDVACGPGNVARYLLDRRPDLRWTGIDLSPNMVALAQEHCPEAQFLVGDARGIGDYSDRFDAVIIAFCLPYLDRGAAIRLVADAAGLLLPDGLLLVSTMEDAYEKSGTQYSSQGDALYMYYHEAGYLVQAMTDHGLTVMDLRRQAYPPEGPATATDLLIVAERSGMDAVV